MKLDATYLCWCGDLSYSIHISIRRYRTVAWAKFSLLDLKPYSDVTACMHLDVFPIPAQLHVAIFFRSSLWAACGPGPHPAGRDIHFPLQLSIAIAFSPQHLSNIRTCIYTLKYKAGRLMSKYMHVLYVISSQACMQYAWLTSKCVMFQVSRRMERTMGVSSRGRLWMPAQSMHRNTPRDTETHSTIDSRVSACSNHQSMCAMCACSSACRIMLCKSIATTKLIYQLGCSRRISGFPSSLPWSLVSVSSLFRWS